MESHVPGAPAPGPGRGARRAGPRGEAGWGGGTCAPVRSTGEARARGERGDPAAVARVPAVLELCFGAPGRLPTSSSNSVLLNSKIKPEFLHLCPLHPHTHS